MNYDEMKSTVRTWREACLPDCSGPNDSYCREIDSITSDELDSICDEHNAEWTEQDSGLRIHWSMGEFRPSFKRQRELALSN